MDYLYSRNIIEKNKLIPRKISKKIINFINFDESNFEKQKDLKMSKYISYDKLCEIRKNFQKFKKGKIKNTLRNYYIYEYIKKNNPDLLLNFDENKNKLNIPEVNGIRISLSSLLVNGLISQNENNFQYKSFFYTSLKKLFVEAGFKKPKQNYVDRFYNLILQKKRTGEKLIVVTPCCPDYSNVKKNNKYEFTFNSIEDGQGLVAKRLFENIEDIKIFFKNIKIDYDHYIVIGDFEAFSFKNQKRLKLSENQYLFKVLQNQKVINTIFKDNHIKSNKSFCQIFGNKSTWIKHVKKYKILFNENNSKFIKDKIENFDRILDSRISLYKKWYGDLNRKKYEKILIGQAAEYASMGYLIKKKFKDAIILGADHYRMSEFYQLGSDRIVFYLKKNYIT